MGLFNNDASTDAIALLTRDHKTVDALFKDYEKAEDGQRKVAIVNDICRELSIHALIEEEIFYPKAFKALDKEGDDLVREAIVEHGSLKGLMALLDGNNTKEEMFGAYVKVLMEYVKHHVKEEENELFPKVRATDLDLETLGQEMQARKEQLLKQAKDDGKPRGAVALPNFARAA